MGQLVFRGRRRRTCFQLLTIALVLAICLLTLEGFIRVFPGVLPVWYRSTFPVEGIELFHRGILAETPIHGVPMPYRFGSRGDSHGGPPIGLQAMGLVAAKDNPDLERYPDVHFHFDRWGLANPKDLESADVLLVGDSFTHAMGGLSPPGLQSVLQQETGLTLFNLGIPAIGPRREAWLLDNIGLARHPKAVIWCFFGGNDLADAVAVARHESRGIQTYADLFPDFSWPRSRLLDLISKAAARNRRPKRPMNATARLPGFSFVAHDGVRSVWFHPQYLRELTRTREQLVADPGWPITTEVLTEVAANLVQQEIRLMVVYVPSKPQVYLPWVGEDRALAWRMASFGASDPPADSAEDFWRLATENRGNLEVLLSELCESQGIPFISLTDRLTDLARRGELGYFAADTHWNEVGQAVAVEPLKQWLTSQPVQATDPHRVF